MQVSRSSPWVNLHTYFRLSLLGTNFFILGLTIGITTVVNFFFSFPISLIGYGLIMVLLCNQFLSIYINNLNIKKNPVDLSQFFSYKRMSLLLQLWLCSCALIYPFYYFKQSVFFSSLYSLLFLLFSPAIICSLLSKNSLLLAISPIVMFSFIVKNLPNYLFFLISITLMGLGYKTIIYYTSLWVQTEYMPIITIELGAYLFIVSGYILSDLIIEEVSLSETELDAQHLIFLKKNIALGDYESIHDYFKPSTLSNHSSASLDFYLKFLLTTQDEQKINTFGNKWIIHLFQSSDFKKAVSVYELIIKKNPYFYLLEPLINFTLAKHFLCSKQFLIVIHLLEPLPEKCQHFVHLPEVLLMLAKAYIELNLESKAKEVMNILTQQFPKSNAYLEAVTLQKILQISSTGRQPPGR